MKPFLQKLGVVVLSKFLVARACLEQAQNLKANRPEVIARVVQILKQHPEYSTRWLPKLTNAPGPDLVILMLAARWPD